MPKMSDLEDFLKPYMVENDDLLELLDSGRIIPANETKFGRSQFQITVGLPDHRIKVWSLNKTTRDRLTKEWGEDSERWVNHHVKVEKNRENVRGEMRGVLYGRPAPTPLVPSQQKTIDSQASKVDKIIALILNQRPDLTGGMVDALVAAELRESGGVFDEDTAAVLVARALGVSLEKSGIQVA